MRWFNFLSSRFWQILVFLAMVLVYLIHFWLWHFPLIAFINSSLMVLLIFVIHSYFAYFRWRAREEKYENLVKENERLSQELRNQELASKESEDLIRVWSHQMKAPLAAIDLMSQTEIEKTKLKNQTFLLENYLKILLEMQRIQNLSSDFYFESFKTSELVKEIVRKYSSFFIQKDLSVKIEGEWQLTSDRRWFSVALEQLVNNAIKYTSRGGIKVFLQEGVLFLEDTGQGILAEDIPRLFDHGFTGYNGRRQAEKSTGLGLYLAKMIFDKLDFVIEIRSEVGKGTQVKISKKMLLKS